MIQLKLVFSNNDEGLKLHYEILNSMTYVASLEYLNEKPLLKKNLNKEIYDCNIQYAMAVKAPIAGTGR